MVLSSQRGQTMVEYILLLVVAVSLVITFYNSRAFQRLFGAQGEVAQNIKSESEFSYRHGFVRDRPENDSGVVRDIRQHPSYKNFETGETRFFGPKEPYN